MGTRSRRTNWRVGLSLQCDLRGERAGVRTKNMGNIHTIYKSTQQTQTSNNHTNKTHILSLNIIKYEPISISFILIILLTLLITLNIL